MTGTSERPAFMRFALSPRLVSVAMPPEATGKYSVLPSISAGGITIGFIMKPEFLYLWVTLER